MKNIHLIPTEKPSRLWLYKNFDNLLTGLTVEKSKDIYPQHIYITSDGEIKEGDWIYYTSALGFCKTTIGSKGLEQEGIPAKKIILTTDPQLIEDGVQDIDETFLEWFVKNPSCEFVEVGKLYKNGYGNWYRNDSHFISSETKYKIIIPKEEPKQETLEEAAEKYHNKISKKRNTQLGVPSEDFIEGAKWQAEKMYSEEDLKKAIDLARVFSKITENDGYDEFEYTPIEIIQQFKKKQYDSSRMYFNRIDK